MVMLSSRYAVLAKYQAGSNTIRKIPENYCLIAFDEVDQPKFDVDVMTTPYRDLVIAAYDMWQTTGSKSKDRLAETVSIALTEYNPFKDYPSWVSYDVFYAIRQLRQSNSVSNASELEHRFRELLNERRRARNSGNIKTEKVVNSLLDEHIDLVYEKYSS